MFFIVSTTVSSAKVGYSLNVQVNDSNSSSFWSRGLSTQILAFTAESRCVGTGNSSKYVSISGFAGMGLKEAGYSKAGRLIDSNRLGVTSIEKEIHIEEGVSDKSTVYTADINLSMPTVLYSMDDLYYSGRGMSIRNAYINDADKILTNYYGTALSKSVKYGGIFNDSRIWVEVTPKYVNEAFHENRTTAFSISSVSDKYTGFGFSSGNDLIEQVYTGKFQFNTKIIKGREFHLGDNTSEIGWLPCCMPSSDILTEDYNRIFNKYDSASKDSMK